jgi:hypothetical protein
MVLAHHFCTVCLFVDASTDKLDTTTQSTTPPPPPPPTEEKRREEKSAINMM